MNKKAAYIVCLLMVACQWAAAQEEYPRSAKACLELGETYLDQRKWKQAEEAFTASIYRDAYFADAYYGRAVSREHLDLWQEALTDYNIYLEWRPTHAEALFSRAQLRFRHQQYEFAKADFLALLEMPAGETTAVFFQQNAFTGEVSNVFTSQGNNKAYLYNYLALTESALKEYPSAIAHFTQALQFTPTSTDLLVNRGIAYEGAQQPEEARKDFERALLLDPNHALAKHNLASLPATSAQNVAANQLLDEAIDDNPRLPYPYAKRGFARFEKGQFKEALDDYNNAIRIDSSEADYFLNRGLIYEKLNQSANAYADYTKAIRLDEKFEKAWLNRANLLTRLGRWQDAIEDYTVALTYQPDYSAAYYNRGIAYRRIKQNDKACADIRKAEELGMTIPAKLKKQVCE